MRLYHGAQRGSENLGFAYAGDLEELSLDGLDQRASVALMRKYGLIAQVRRIMPRSSLDEILGTPFRLEFTAGEVCGRYEGMGRR